MPDDDFDYYRRRAEEERARAEAVSDPTVARVHRTLAEMYEEQVQGAAEAMPRWAVN